MIVKGVKPRLLVIDTQADVFAGNENSRSEAPGFLDIRRPLTGSRRAMH
jgi:RecA-family ATPase